MSGVITALDLSQFAANALVDGVFLETAACRKLGRAVFFISGALAGLITTGSVVTVLTRNTNSTRGALLQYLEFRKWTPRTVINLRRVGIALLRELRTANGMDKVCGTGAFLDWWRTSTLLCIDLDDDGAIANGRAAIQGLVAKVAPIEAGSAEITHGDAEVLPRVLVLVSVFFVVVAVFVVMMMLVMVVVLAVTVVSGVMVMPVLVPAAMVRGLEVGVSNIPLGQINGIRVL